MSSDVRRASAYGGAYDTVARPRLWEWPRTRAFEATVLSLTLGFIFLYGMNLVPLASLNEGLYAECAREMVETGDWLTPRINTIAYWEKPPLLYWAVALSLRTFGYSEMAARLPSVLALLGTCLMTFLFSSHAFDRRTGWISAGILASAPYFTTQQQLVMFDGLLTFFFAAATFSFALGRDDRRWYLVSAVALGLAVMTKGFLALFLFVPMVALYRLLSGRPLKMGYAAWAAPLIFLAVIAPWHIYESVTQPGFAWFYFINEHFLRFIGKKVPPDFQTGQFYEPLLRSMMVMTPLGFFLIPAVISSFRQRKTDLLPLLWFIVPLAFFSTSTAKATYYMVIAAPALAIMLALFLQRQRKTSWLSFALAGIAIIAILFAFKVRGEVRIDEFERLRQAAVLNLLTLLAVALLLSAAFSAMGRWRTAIGGFCVMMVLLKLGALHIASPLGPYASEKAVAEPLRALLQQAPGMPLIIDDRLENHSSLVFYLSPQVRPMLMAAPRWGDLWWGSFFDGKASLFISREQAWNMVRSDRALYCLEKDKVPPGAQIVCEGGYMAVVAGPRLARRLRLP